MKKQAMQKCLNDMFGGYCTEKPEAEKEARLNWKVGDEVVGHSDKQKCKLNLKTCGFYVPFSEVVKLVENLGSGMRIVPSDKSCKKEKAEKTKEEAKPEKKSKGKKKEKAEASFRQETLL